MNSFEYVKALALRYSGLQSGTTPMEKCRSNIRKMLVFSVLSGVFASIQSTGVIDTYIYTLAGGSNQAVGIGGSLAGLAVVVMAYPSGMLIDRFHRSTLLRASSITLMALQLVFIFAITSQSIPFLYAIQTLIAVVGNLQASSAYAMFSDSMQQGTRSYWMSVQFVLTSLASTAGPLVSMCLFLLVGDSWDLGVMRSVLVISTACMIPCYIWNLNWQRVNADDVYNQHTGSLSNDQSEMGRRSVNPIVTPESPVGKLAAPKQVDPLDKVDPGRISAVSTIHGDPRANYNIASSSPRSLEISGVHPTDFSHGDRSPRNPTQYGSGPDSPISTMHSPTAQGESRFAGHPSMTGSSSASSDVSQGLEDSSHRNEDISHPHEPENHYNKWVPILQTTVDLIIAFGAGITVKFFPLFFKTDYNLPPSSVQLLYVGYGLSYVIFTWLITPLCKLIGRVKATIVFHVCGIATLSAMIEVSVLWLMILLFEIRGGFQNAVSPIDKSIVMDYVDTRTRGRWNALESIAGLSWAGSALLGGYMADHHGYKFAFQITVGIYCLALCFRAPLLWIVQSKEGFSH